MVRPNAYSSFGYLKKVDHMIKVLKAATPEEREQLEPIFNKKAASALREAAPAAKKQLENKIEEAGELFVP